VGRIRKVTEKALRSLKINRIIVGEGEEIPRGYAFTYYTNAFQGVYYPYGIAHIINWTSSLYIFLRFYTTFRMPSRMQVMYNRGYKDGYEQATEDVISDIRGIR